MYYTDWYFILAYALVGSILLCLLLGRILRLSAPRLELQNAHVIITGGSAGIGLAMAKSFAAKGSHVTILSRTLTTLQSAVSEIEKGKVNKNQIIQYIQADVSDIAVLQRELGKAVDACGGRLDVLVCSAGYSHPQRFEQLTADVFRKQMEINYHGVVNACIATLPYLKSAKNSKGPKRIMIVSSMAAMACISAFSAYSPTKAAVRAFAQCLDMELHPFNIRTQLVNPPDVDTPGYREEMKLKPKECHKISEGSGLWKAEDIARKAVDGVENYKFEINYGMDGILLGSYCVGLQPVSSAWGFLLELVIVTPLRIVAAFLIHSWYGIVQNVYKEEKVSLLSDQKDNNDYRSIS